MYQAVDAISTALQAKDAKTVAGSSGGGGAAAASGLRDTALSALGFSSMDFVRLINLIRHRFRLAPDVALGTA